MGSREELGAADGQDNHVRAPRAARPFYRREVEAQRDQGHTAMSREAPPAPRTRPA